MILAAAFYFGALTAAALAVGYLAHDVWLDLTARRRRAARQRTDDHVKAMSRLRTGGRTFATIRAAQAARARNGAAPLRPLLLVCRPDATRTAAPWPVTWVQQVLPVRGFGPEVEDVVVMPSWR